MSVSCCKEKQRFRWERRFGTDGLFDHRICLIELAEGTEHPNVFMVKVTRLLHPRFLHGVENYLGRADDILNILRFELRWVLRLVRKPIFGIDVQDLHQKPKCGGIRLQVEPSQILVDKEGGVDIPIHTVPHHYSVHGMCRPYVLIPVPRQHFLRVIQSLLTERNFDCHITQQRMRRHETILLHVYHRGEHVFVLLCCCERHDDILEHALRWIVTEQFHNVPHQ
mmetsp:Transcript_24589/g.47119  ORF Transcript_24589/g.47119 Transcript_24589/m.47119 type:complete len:224 (+) Transcript_24589:698-1369(+)